MEIKVSVIKRVTHVCVLQEFQTENIIKEEKQIMLTGNTPEAQLPQRNSASTMSF